MLRRVGGREKLAGGNAGGVRAGTIAEWRSRLGVMSSDYSDWQGNGEEGAKI